MLPDSSAATRRLFHIGTLRARAHLYRGYRCRGGRHFVGGRGTPACHLVAGGKDTFTDLIR